MDFIPIVQNVNDIEASATNGTAPYSYGWNTGETTASITPAVQTVTYHINGISQDDWIKQITEEIKKHTDKPIRFRNKPRPGNSWWETDIKEDLKNAHCLVTNMKDVHLQIRDLFLPSTKYSVICFIKRYKVYKETNETWKKDYNRMVKDDCTKCWFRALCYCR